MTLSTYTSVPLLAQLTSSYYSELIFWLGVLQVLENYKLSSPQIPWINFAVYVSRPSSSLPGGRCRVESEATLNGRRLVEKRIIDWKCRSCKRNDSPFACSKSHTCVGQSCPSPNSTAPSFCASTATWSLSLLTTITLWRGDYSLERTPGQQEGVQKSKQWNDRRRQGRRSPPNKFTYFQRGVEWRNGRLESTNNNYNQSLGGWKDVILLATFLLA